MKRHHQIHPLGQILPLGLLLAGALGAGCVTARPPLGRVTVKAEHPLFATQVINETRFKLEEGRLVLSAPGNATEFDLAVEGDCLRGSVRTAGAGQRRALPGQEQICAVPPQPGAPEVRWWKNRSDLRFTTELSKDGERLWVQVGTERASFHLEPGPIGDALRQHPELLGAAFAFGYVPAAHDDPANRDLLAYSYSVSGTKE